MFGTLYRKLDARFGAGRGLTRRDALRAGAAASAGLLLREHLGAAPPAKKPRRVVVIGAGFAALACADELAYAGYDVTVVEARDRLGGRVQSLKDEQFVKGGKCVELGGELVGPNQPTWWAYKQRFGLEYLPLDEDPTDVIVLGGKVLKQAEAKALYKEMRDALRKGLNAAAEPIPAYAPWEAQGAAALDRQSLADWIARQNVSERCKAAMAVQFTAINGVVPAWQSLLAVLATVQGAGRDGYWDETDTCHVKGGCQQLAAKLAESVASRKMDFLRLNCPVRAVRAGAKGVSVEVVENGRAVTLEADDVVVTAPPSTWKKINFRPALPPGLVTPMAENLKYLSVSVGRPWKAAKRSVNALSDGAVQMTWETTAKQDGKDPAAEEHVLVAYSGGTSADECRGWRGHPDAKHADKRYAEELDKLWPGYAAAWRRGRVMDWLADPYSRGSYSFPAPGQVTVAGPLLSKGLGRVHFAGEHCCYAFTGWMEGALASGVRLARRFAERDGLVKPLAKDAGS
jgi:monoamine oxidase